MKSFYTNRRSTGLTYLMGSALAMVLFLVAPLEANAQAEPNNQTITKVGTTAAQFLKLGVGARAIALGGTFVAQANDLSALYWNPAGLSNLNGSAVQLARTDYLAGINYNFAGFGTNIGNLGTIAASLIFLDSGSMQVRTEEAPEGTGEEFDVQNFALQLSFGKALTDKFSVGTTVKYIQESIWHSSASAIAFDIGVLFTTPYENLRLGANMANFGPKMQISGRDILFSEDPNPDQEGNVEIVNAQFLTDGHPLPLIFRIGLAWDAMNMPDHTITLMTDAAHPNDNSEYMNVGMEYVFRDFFSLRSGLRNMFETDGEQGLTLGAGLNLRLDRALRIRFDYAYADFGRLEETHWVTVDLAF
ncbi:MAG: PorV/PorQ family protein [Bacteroidota bacterium]